MYLTEADENKTIYTYETLNEAPDYDFIFKAEGFCKFFSTSNGIDVDFINKEMYYFYEEAFIDEIYHKITGLSFLQCVRDGGFINYDGTLCDVYVNGYKSNLGLKEKGIYQGKFIVTGDVFEDLCKTYDIWVNWANK